MRLSAGQHEEVSLVQVVSAVRCLDAGFAGEHRIERCDSTLALLNAPGLSRNQLTEDAALLAEFSEKLIEDIQTYIHSKTLAHEMQTETYRPSALLILR
jgi:hypothetical protein